MTTELKSEFHNPNAEFSPIPFWFWNADLSEEEIGKQIQDFYNKGVMGFVIHPRIGMSQDIEYLSDRFMQLVKFAVSRAEHYGMKVILYDEGMYPSGSAHGMVVKKNPEYSSRGLRMVEYLCMDNHDFTIELGAGEEIVAVIGVEKVTDISVRPDSIVMLEINDGKVSFDVSQQGNWYILAFVETFSKGTIRGIHFGEDDGEPNSPPSGDLMNKAAMEKFIALTHERYFVILKEYFGKTIIAMFTDEPSVMGRCHLPDLIPWTSGFLEYFEQCGNNKLDLPALWLDVGAETEMKRKKYRKAINLRLETTYYAAISTWCEQHGIALTGHPEYSNQIGLLKHFHIPGQDVVWRVIAPEDEKGLIGIDSTMGKCTSDAARHGGKRKNANECFGCCGKGGINWAFSAADMKWYLDWLFVRGVNLIYPHAFYYSIEGEKRFQERSPDVGPNNIWWRYYNVVSGYIKRMCWLMTDSINVTSIAVLCEEDHLPWTIVKPLYENQIEFNYLEENILLAQDCAIKEGRISVASYQYKVILVEESRMLIGDVAVRLQEFLRVGGTIIVYNPECKSELLEGVNIVEEFSQIIEIISSKLVRDVVFLPNSKELRISHVIKNGIHFFLLVNEGNRTLEGNLCLNIYGKVEKWDAWKSIIEEVRVDTLDSCHMEAFVRLSPRESIILCINPGEEPDRVKIAEICNDPKYLEVTEEWEVSRLDGKQELTTFKLESWTEWSDMEHFSGTLVYKNTFVLNDCDKAERIELDLGDVCEIAHIYVNSKDAGFKMWAPYAFDITSMVKHGKNIVEVEVTNTLANKMEKAKLKSGLLGPVYIIMI